MNAEIKITENVSVVTFSDKSTSLFTCEVFEKIGAAKIDIDMISIELSMSDMVTVGFTFFDDDLQRLLPIIKNKSITPLVTCGNVKFTINTPDMIGCPGFASKVFSTLKSVNCMPLLVTTGLDEISLLVRESDSADAEKSLAELFQ